MSRSGLCYTKLENGRPSFGACCFTTHRFETHHLIGYYHRSQPTPKPIYKRNRIVLGGDSGDTSAETFINANEIAPGLIAAQCPMTAYPNGFANTVEDMKRMIVEKDVRVWVQLSPSSPGGELMTGKSDGSTKSFCDVFPLKYFSLPGEGIKSNIHQKGESDFRYVHHPDKGYFNMTYKLSAFVRRRCSNNDIVDTEFDALAIVRILKHSNQVGNKWFGS